MNITTHRGSRPLAVKIAVGFLAASGGTDLVLRTIWHHSHHSDDSDFYVSLAVVFIILSLLLYFLFRGHNWARWVVLSTLVVGTILSLVPHFQRHSGLYFLYLLMNTVAIVALFRRPSGQWFRGKSNDTHTAA
jgi:hypothetical protein